MYDNLLNITYNMFKDRSQRKNSKDDNFTYFYRFIGVKDINNYDNILKTLQYKCNEHKDVCIVFDNIIPLSGEMELIQYIYNELNTMNIDNLVNEEINLYSNEEVNNIFLQGLDYVVSLAIKKENFFNENVRNNFITKLIVWGYTYLNNINFYDDRNPKCIYYGNIDKHEIYFLMLLYTMGFDVIYINPLKEEYWCDIDSDNLSICIKEMSILSVDSFKERASKGRVIENTETITKQIQREVQQELFSNTGIFKPWQFRNGYTKSILLDTILEDIYIYWNEPAKLRPEFGVIGDIVKVPCLFMKIDGENNDINEYQKLVKYCISSENTLFFNSGEISKEKQVGAEKYELMFYQLSDGTFDIDEIKKLPFYKFNKYSEEVQNFLLEKFNETVLDKSNLFINQFNRETSIELLAIIISLNEDIIRLADNFDFTGNIPKVVIYLDNEEEITDTMLMLLGYLHNIGIDIVIFNPSGLLNIANVLNGGKINIIRLDKMNYTSSFKTLISYKHKQKQGVLSRILKI